MGNSRTSPQSFAGALAIAIATANAIAIATATTIATAIAIATAMILLCYWCNVLLQAGMVYGHGPRLPRRK